MLLLLLYFLLAQQSVRDGALAARIQDLFHTALTADNDAKEKSAEAQMKTVFAKHGLPAIRVVGDDASYKFVVLACSSDSTDFQKLALRSARAAVRDHEIPSDAALYCDAHIRHETLKAQAKKRPPTNPALRDRIEQIYRSDQAVRDKEGFDREKMAQADREHAPVLEDIFAKYGAPTYRMVGPQASDDFITMIQHQSPEFRAKVLPLLKANVEAGQADPESYAKALDRSLTDAGRKQQYGENLTCDLAHPKLRTGPIEDVEHVDARRAAIGLLRLELCAQIVTEMSPDICRSEPQTK
jgi:hypothetical protein